MGNSKSKKTLSDEDLEFLVEQTNYDQVTIRQWYSEFMATSPGGELRQDKFIEMYNLVFPDANAKEFCDQVFRTFDIDNNGYIDFKEFMLAIYITVKGNAEEKIKFAFRMYDINTNGTIELAEMTRIIKAIYEMLNLPTDKATDSAKEIFERIDVNNDGVVTEEEFITACLKDGDLYRKLAPS